MLRAVATNVRRFREARGLTQATLAEAIGIQTRYLQQIEHEDASPSLRRLVAMSQYFGVDVVDLLRPAPALARRNPGRPRKAPAR